MLKDFSRNEGVTESVGKLESIDRTNQHIVVLGFIIGYVDNNKNREYHQSQMFLKWSVHLCITPVNWEIEETKEKREDN